ncbi:MAG: urease accessory protein UreD [Microcoleus sp. SIO2G3]|nr:urease accessory protein UreD [Microcoleus sp. SIO2G3]
MLPERDRPPPSSRWQGCLQLDYAQRQNVTQLVRAQVQAPLKVQRSFHPEGAVCHSVILHTAGGIVGGDRLALEINLQPQSHTLITTAAAAKIYRSQGAQAEQITQIQVGENACLEWLPQEAIVFTGANYQQTTHIELAPGALWMGWEMTRLGRSARGERFEAGEWRSRTEVWQQGKPLWIDPQWVQGGSDMMDSPHGLNGAPVVGSFACVGRSMSADLVEAARAQWTGAGEIGVTRLMQGMLCRYRGDSTIDLRRWFIAVWHLARQEWLDRPACKQRVWP